MNIKRQIWFTMMDSMGNNLEKIIENYIPKQKSKTEQSEKSKNYFLQKAKEKRMRKAKSKRTKNANIN